MSYLGSWKLTDYLVFACNTHNATTGAATDDDASPTYRIYEDETATPVATGTMAKLDDANTTGFYSERIQLTSPTFSQGKSYTVYIQATVGAVMGTISHQFQIGAEVNNTTVASAIADAVWDESTGQHVIPGSFGEWVSFFTAIEDITPAMIADAVWDETKASHVIPDTFGDYLDDEITSRLAPTTPGATLDVTPNGNAGIDWGNIDNNSATASLSNTSTSVVSTVTNVVMARMVAIGEISSATNLHAISGANFEHFFRNEDAVTTKVVDDVGGAGSSLTVGDIADGVWDEARLSHLAAGSFGEFVDWVLHKDTNRTFDRSTDSLEAIRDAMATGGAIPSVGAIADAVWDELRAGHVIDGSFGQGTIAYSLLTQAKADVNEQADIALSDIRLNELISIANTTKPTKDSFLDLIINKDVNQTFDRATDSLEALSDSAFKITTIIDGTIDVLNILKRIHALVSGNGSTRDGDIITYKDASANNYLRHTITDTSVTTALV